MTRERWDVAVIGAGPAGSVAAHGLARKGYSVLLMDKSSFPRSKVCGGCLNKHAVEMIYQEGLGDILDAVSGESLREFRLGIAGQIISFPLPGGRAVSRHYLDAALVQKAQEAGAVFKPEVRARLGPLGKDGRTVFLSNGKGDSAVSAGVVLVCHGLAEKNLPETEETLNVEPDSRFGVSTVLDDEGDHEHDFEPGVLSMAYSPGGYAGIVRLEDGRLNVAAALNYPGKKENAGLNERTAAIFKSAGFPEVRGLERAEWNGTPALTRSRKSVAGERFLLLGDAAGYSEPFTGEGIAWALDSAVFISRLIEAPGGWQDDYAERWQKTYRRLILPRRRFSRQVAQGLRHPAFVQSVGGILARTPGLIRPWMRAVCEPSVL